MDSKDLFKPLKRAQIDLDSFSDQDKFRNFMKMAPIAIYEIDFYASKFRSVNEALCKLLGYSEQELLSINPLELLTNESNEIFQEKIKEALASKNIWSSAELEVKAKNGQSVWGLLNARVNYKDGQPDTVLVFAQDITERKKAEETLKENEQLYRILFDNSDDGFILVQPLSGADGNICDFRFLKVNNAYERQTGRKAAVVEGYRAKEIAPDLESNWISLAGEVARKAKAMRYENFNKRTGRWYDAYYFPCANGKVGILFRDITERKKAEQNLDKKQRELNLILDSSPTIIFYKDKQGKIIQANEALGKALKTPKEKLLGKTVFDLYSNEIAQGMADDDFEVMKSKQPKVGIIEPYESPTGLRWIRTDKIPILDEAGAAIGLIGFSEDITNRRETEIALTESEEKYRNLVENSKDAIAIVDFRGRVLFANKTAETLTGYTLQEKRGQNIRIITPKRLWPRSVAMLLKAKRGEMIPYFEYELKRKDGTVIPVESGGQAIYKNGKPVAVQIITRDITERQKAQADLLESEAKYRELVDKLPEMVFEIDSKGRVKFANVRALEQLGYSKKELDRGIDANRFIALEDRERSKENMKLLFIEGMRQSNEYLFVGKNGTRFPVLLTSAPILKDKKIVGARGIAIDLTEQKAVEKQLKENERLTAIGTTAGMVGHDIRNPLQSITGDVYLMKNDLKGMPQSEARESVLESLNNMENNVDYINKIVQDLQDYTRTLTPTMKKFGLEIVCKEALNNKAIPENITTSCHIDKEVEEIVSDVLLLKRILANLVNNAVQAMPRGGKLQIQAAKTANSIKIVVEDTGSGIPDEIKPKLFTPLFTTKSKGQGFGLAVVKRMTETLGGTVTFESQKGKGTKFTINLPLC